MINFDQYKPYLREYLAMHGIRSEDGRNIRCFSPTHNDSTASLKLDNEHFYCFGCEISGDIYDAVRILEGISEPEKQFKHIQGIFGGGEELKPIPRKPKSEEEKKLSFIPEANSKAFEDYLRSTTNKAIIDAFLRDRAKYSTGGKIANFPPEIAENLRKYLFWWNGIPAATQDGIKDELLFSVGAIHEIDGKIKKTFFHSGVIIKIGIGYKLHFYEYDAEKKKFICRKFGSHQSKGFPCPNIPLPEKIVIMEGELKALVCQAAGLTNVFSCGGTKALTKPVVKHFLTNKVKEITLFFDNDSKGKEQLEPARKTLRKAGFEGKIFFAKADELREYKDADEAILFGHLDFVQSAISNAFLAEENESKTEKLSENDEKTAAAATGEKNGKGNLSPRQVKELLKKISLQQLTEAERPKFLSALVNACNDFNHLVPILLDWGLKIPEIPEIDDEADIQFLISVCKNHKIPEKTIQRLKEALENETDLKKTLATSNPLTDVNFEEVAKTDFFKTFIEKDSKKSEKEAANILEYYLRDKLIYIEDLKEFYFFDGLVWSHRSDVTDIAYDILKELTLQYFDRNLYEARKPLEKLGNYKFCQTVMKALAEKPSIYRKTIFFDSIEIKETLTLQDGVIDFSGDKVIFRNAQPEEYRMKKLPYTVAECQKIGEPKHFLKFMSDNFDNKDTLNSLMYFLSLIPSRNAQFKIGGIFTGKPHTGKTTTMEIISDIYPEMTTPIPRSLIMNSKYGNDDSGATPATADLEGMGAGISDETEKNDHLNSAMWKKLTGGGKMKARQLYKDNRVFYPTAQTIILTNYSPLFDKADTAVIDRMLIIQFAKQHLKGEEGTKSIDELKAEIHSEAPLIVRMFAEKYIELKKKFKGKIPLSEESKAYKTDYIENMDDNGLQGFVQKYLDFEKGSGKWVLLSDVYKRYCVFWNVELDDNGKPTDPEKLTQTKFTRYLKRDYNEFKVKQMRVNGYPEQVVIDAVLKDWNEVPEQNLTTEPKEYKPKIQQQSYEEENPFDGMEMK